MNNEWLTYEQAAELLGCHISRITKLINRGELRTRQQITGHKPRGGSFRRAELERIAAADARRKRERISRRAEVEDAEALRRPPDDHEWISIPEAARQLGLTDKAVLARIHRDRLPATRVVAAMSQDVFGLGALGWLAGLEQRSQLGVGQRLDNPLVKLR
ncbi:hypothetical protein GCM10027596_16660 [Nocardioides korecus]